MAKAAITIIKRSPYRGITEEWSNQYHFVEAPPSNPAGWIALIDSLVDAERQIYPSAVQVARAYGYTDSSLNAAFTRDYVALGISKTGQLTGMSTSRAPGDAAGWVRWTTPKRNTKGRTVYLRKYFHHVYESASDPDTWDPTQKAAALAFAKQLDHESAPLTGFTICGPDGTLGTPAAAGQFLTTRTLHRRGKRPPS